MSGPTRSTNMIYPKLICRFTTAVIVVAVAVVVAVDVYISSCITTYGQLDTAGVHSRNISNQ